MHKKNPFIKSMLNLGKDVSGNEAYKPIRLLNTQVEMMDIQSDLNVNDPLLFINFSDPAESVSRNTDVARNS